MKSLFKDIPEYKDWNIIREVKEGWSKDKKYYIEDKNGRKLLLRTSDFSRYEDKKIEFERIKLFNALNFTMSRALSFGTCNRGRLVYMLPTWIDGVSLGKIIKDLPRKEQYNLGISAGKILKDIHSIPVNNKDIPTKNKIDSILQKLDVYENISVRVDNDEPAISYLRNNINKISSLPPVYAHGDFHVGNLIYTPNKTIGVIDFNHHDCGDSVEEFFKIQSFDVEVSIPFSIGQIHGYFNGNPPMEFWETLAVYVAYSSLNSITWAVKFGEDEVKGMHRRCYAAFDDYNNFDSVIPNWYENYI